MGYHQTVAISWHWGFHGEKAVAEREFSPLTSVSPRHWGLQRFPVGHGQEPIFLLARDFSGKSPFCGDLSTRRCWRGKQWGRREEINQMGKKQPPQGCEEGDAPQRAGLGVGVGAGRTAGPVRPRLTHHPRFTFEHDRQKGFFCLKSPKFGIIPAQP